MGDQVADTELELFKVTWASFTKTGATTLNIPNERFFLSPQKAAAYVVKVKTAYDAIGCDKASPWVTCERILVER